MSIGRHRAWVVGATLAAVLGIALPPLTLASVPFMEAISAGGSHTCALKTDATVWCWGSAVYGEVGDGTRGDAKHRRLTPVQVVQGSGKLTDVTAITASNAHTCALRTDATVWCWGSAWAGQLGDGTTGNARYLRLSAVQVVLGAGYLTDVQAISAGAFHTCALKTDTTVWCWGDDEYGQLGDGTYGNGQPLNLRLEPVQVKQGAGLLTDVQAISAGGSHTCALKIDATLWCWGDDNVGALGDGTTGDNVGLRLDPVQVVLGTGKLTDVVAISAGESHTCAVRTDGSAWCWGWDGYGQLGDGTVGNRSGNRLKPVQVRQGSGTLTGVQSISASHTHTCALKANATVWCWGDNSSGQLGDGTTGGQGHRRLKAVQVVQGTGHLTGVRAISAGGAHTCARKGNGWCWGWDHKGQLGDGTTGNANHVRLKPVRVDFP